MARKIIDLDSVQPNGKRGETQRPAFTKINENFAEVYDALTDVAKIPETVGNASHRARSGKESAYQWWPSVLATPDLRPCR